MDSTASATVLRFVLGITLAVAGMGKIQNLSAFVQGVLQYQVLPVSLARWYGRLLPFVEIGTGAFLLLGMWLPLVAIMSAAMFLSFAIAVTINLFRKREMPCYCFGADSSDKMGWHTLIRILLLLSATIVLVFSPSAPDPVRIFIRAPSLDIFTNLVPIAFITVFGLLLLSLIEVSPWVIRAWTALAVRPVNRGFSVVWTRDSESQGGTEP